MYYNFDTSNGNLRTWISMDSFNDNVVIYDNNGREVEEVKLYNNADGDLSFKVNNEEILFKNFKAMSMAEFKSAIERGDRVFGNEFVKAIIHDGMENVRFGLEMPVPDMIIPMMGIAMIGDKTVMCECKLVKEYLHMPHDNYKIKLEAVNNKNVCRDRYYVSDFVDLIKSGHIQILDSVDDGVNPVDRIVAYFSEVTSSKYYNYKMKAEAV